jgi:hypothetical protein
MMMNKRGFLKLGITAKLTVIILVLSLFPTAFIGYNAYNEQRRIITEEVTASHLELSNILANGIYEWRKIFLTPFWPIFQSLKPSTLSIARKKSFLQPKPGLEFCQIRFIPMP